jgi:hypothetical protein
MFFCLPYFPKYGLIRTEENVVFRRFAGFLTVWWIDLGGFLFVPWITTALLCGYRKTWLLVNLALSAVARMTAGPHSSADACIASQGVER